MHIKFEYTCTYNIKRILSIEIENIKARVFSRNISILKIVSCTLNAYHAKTAK